MNWGALSSGEASKPTAYNLSVAPLATGPQLAAREAGKSHQAQAPPMEKEEEKGFWPVSSSPVTPAHSFLFPVPPRNSSGGCAHCTLFDLVSSPVGQQGGRGVQGYEEAQGIMQANMSRLWFLGRAGVPPTQLPFCFPGWPSGVLGRF